MRDLLLPMLALCCWALVSLLQCPWRSPEEASLYDVGSSGSLSANDEEPLPAEAADRPTPRRASGDDGSVVALPMPPSELTLRTASRCFWSRLEDTAAISGREECEGGRKAALSFLSVPLSKICFFLFLSFFLPSGLSSAVILCFFDESLPAPEVR